MSKLLTDGHQKLERHFFPVYCISNSHKYVPQLSHPVVRKRKKKTLLHTLQIVLQMGKI